MKRAALLLSLCLLAGCATPPVELNNSDRLIRHPQFKQAVQAAPDFVSDALKTINRLEHELESK